MTTPTIPPGTQHTGVLQAPHPFGLYSAVAMNDLDAPGRLLGGVAWTPSNCGPTGTWDIDLCPEDPPATTKGGARPDYAVYPPMVVWGADECSLYATDIAENRARAQQLLRLQEAIHLEAHLADLIVARATPLPAAPDIASAIGALEQALGASGFTGVIHAPRGFAALADERRLVHPQGARLTTVLSNQWVFGAGYDGIFAEGTLYATGPLTAWRDPVLPREATDPETNMRLAIAERVLAVGWECPTTVYSVAYGGGS